MIVTIDGPAGSGKSTVAKALARRLGFRYLDTGAMYRTVALAGMRRGVDWNDPRALAELAEQATIEMAEDKVLLDGEDVSEAIRSSQVTSVTRFAADNLQVRQHLVRLQRALAAHQDMVTEGRDQGTIAFPDAECKIFLTASPGQRAARRLADLLAQGETKTLEEVLDELGRRDQQDVARSVGGLTAAPDAIEVCTDAMTVEQVVDCLEAIVRRRQNAGAEAPLESRPVDLAIGNRMADHPLLKSFWYECCRGPIYLAARLAYRARFTGVENIPKQGAVLMVSNHQSHFDPPFVGCGCPRQLNFLARDTLFTNSLFGKLLRSVNAIPIDREGGGLAGIKETLRRLKRGEAVLVFPEGTRSPDGEIRPFLPGFTALAVRGRATIVPAAIEGAFDAWPRRRKFPSLGVVHVHYGSPLPLEQVQQLEQRALVAEVERRVRQCQAVLRARPVFASRRRKG